MKIFKFVEEVIVEAKRVIWPKHKEVYVIVLTVCVVVAISSVFFLFVDYCIYNLIDLFLNFRG